MRRDKAKHALSLMLSVTIPALAGFVGIEKALASPTVFPTGVTIHDKADAYDCDLLFAGPDGKTRLIDTSGRIVKVWDYDGQPARIVDPARAQGRQGVVGLRLAELSPSEMTRSRAGIGLNPFGGTEHANKTFGFVDWNGKTLWQWSGTEPEGAALQHHDWAVLPNGNTLVLSDTVRRLPRFGDRDIIDDIVYEVDPAGKVVWSWSASDHLDEMGFTSPALALVEHSPQADYLHVNSMSVLGRNRWAQAGDARFAPNNILISSRNANFTAIIDHESGHIVWRLGPDYAPHRPKALSTPRPIDQISGQHDPQLIADGLPGAGNLLMFDNQGEAGYPPVSMQLLGGSRVLEIEPTTKRILWEYTGANSGRANFTFFSPYISSAQRLPNGNTLIDEGIDGRFFQVTQAGRIVWEYVSPFTGPAPQAPAPGQDHPAESNWVYRVQCVPPSWLPASARPSSSQVPRPQGSGGSR